MCDRNELEPELAESKPLYGSFVRAMIHNAYDGVPRIPLFLPSQGVPMQSNVQGCMCWFQLQPDYRQPDCRQLGKA